MNIYWQSNQDMSAVVDSSVQLCLMSPPQPMQYDSVYMDSYIDYNIMILQKVNNKLKPKGILCFVTTDNYHSGTLVLRHAMFLKAIKDAGFNVFSIKIWSRGDFVELYRPSFSYIIMASKEKSKSLETVNKMHKAPFGWDVWKITDEYKLWKQYSAFPAELAQRCIECFTNPGDTVLDPYSGTGTTPICAHKMGRIGIGYELDASLLKAFEDRCKEIRIVKSSEIQSLGSFV